MTVDEMYKALNKGLPVYLIVELDVDTLVNSCASDRAALINSIRKIKKNYQDAIVNLAGYSKAQHYFFKKLMILTNTKNAETTINVSPYPFLESIKDILGVDNPSMDFNDGELYRALLARVDVLDQIQNKPSLVYEFPLIADDYELSKKAYRKILANEPNGEKTQESIRLRKLFYKYGLHTKFDTFMEHQKSMYRNLVKRRQFVEGYTTRNPIDLSMFEGLDKEKFELYLASKYLEKAMSTSEIEEKQECLYYLITYIREVKVSDISIINEEGIEISFKYILRNVKKLLKSNLELRPIDEDRSAVEGYHINHVQNHINKYFKSLPINIGRAGSIEFNSLSDERKEAIYKYYEREYVVLSPEEREKRIQERFREYERKIKFYETSAPVYKFFGSDDFDGYVIYIYPNGLVVLDKLYKDYLSMIPCIDEAIYYMSIEEFEKLNGLDKQELLTNSNVKRMYHNDTWEKRLKEKIENPDLYKYQKEDVKRLLKKYKNEIKK